MEIHTEKQGMDEEWIQLIMEAQDLGLSPSEIREFLQSGREESPSSYEKEKVPYKRG